MKVVTMRVSTGISPTGPRDLSLSKSTSCALRVDLRWKKASDAVKLSARCSNGASLNSTLCNEMQKPTRHANELVFRQHSEEVDLLGIEVVSLFQVLDIFDDCSKRLVDA